MKTLQFTASPFPMASRRSKLRGILLGVAIFASGLLPNAALGERGPERRANVAQAENPVEARVIVKYKTDSAMMHGLSATGETRRPQHAAALSQRLRVPLADGRVLGRRTQSLRGSGLTSYQLAAQLTAQPDVEWAVPDQRRRITALPPPDDPYLTDNQPTITPVAGQWYLRAPTSIIVSAINAVAAWNLISPGASAVTVAVLDTGVRFDHPDLVNRLYAGFDFVHDTPTANDGDGRDADASDPGDATAFGECSPGEAGERSSWHGTQVAGLLGAQTNNGIGMASVGREAVMLLPVRVLGKCGGYDSDIIAAMRWAAGTSSEVGFGSSVTRVNSHPAKVINMSLGSTGACPASYRDVIAELNAAGVTVVSAAGNENGLAVNAPANCPGVIAVAGLRHVGSKVGYSSVGPEVAIAAPAGNCVNVGGTCLYPLLTTDNTGTTGPLANTFSDGTGMPSYGTSFSAPLVAGTVGLMLARNPALTTTGVRAVLQSSARPFPTTGGEVAASACHAPNGASQIECYCTTSTCGAGMLDSAGAVSKAFDPTVAIAVSTATPTAGTAVTLDGSGTVVYGGHAIVSYRWTITDGAGIASFGGENNTQSILSADPRRVATAASFSGATNGPTASLLATGAGNVTVQLAVTDDTGATATSSTSIAFAAAPVVVPGSSGGGALGWDWLLGLAAVAAILLVSRSRTGAQRNTSQRET